MAAGLVANPPMKCSDVTSVVHAGGVNISLLALVLHCIPLSAGDVRALVMTEMVARACGNALWQIMRTDACGDEDEARSIISHFVSNICDPAEFPKLWKSVLEDRLKGKYIGYGSAGPAITPDQVSTPQVPPQVQRGPADHGRAPGRRPHQCCLHTQQPRVPV